MAMTFMLHLAACGQVPQSADGVVGRATGRLANINLNGPGYMYYGINGADRGLGYVGSYMTLGGFIPTLEDDFGGIWNADVRGHLSVNSGFFSNVGAVRKQLLNSGALLGFGVFWDYDGDLYQYPIAGADEPGAIFGPYGHVFQQVGISGEFLTDWGNFRTNGYIPVGQTGNQLVTNATGGGVFYQNSILPQNGLSAALGGADLELGAYLPGLADWAGMINVGGYAFGNTRYTKVGGENHGGDLVPWFGGVYTRLDMTFANNWDFSLQYNNDSFFNSTGFARLTYRMGGSRRRNVPDQMEQPMFRNEHIVRAVENPIAALNPQNNNQLWHVIHVDNQAAPNGNGTAEAPFRTLAEAQNAGLPGGRNNDPWNITYVHQGNATSTFTAYTDPFTFTADSQFLVGSGGPLTIATQPFNGETLLTIGALTSGNPVLSTPGQSNITIASPNPAAPVPTNVGGVTIANLSIIGSGTGISGSGNLTREPTSAGLPFPQPVGTTNNPFGTPIANTGGSAVRNVSISGNGTSNSQTGVVIAAERQSLVASVPNTNPTGGIEFSDTAIDLMTADGFEVGLQQLSSLGPPQVPVNPPAAIPGSGGDVNIDYSGSITNNRNNNGNVATLLVTITGKTGGEVNLAATSTPSGATVENQIQDVAGQGISLVQNASGTRINMANVTLAESDNTAIFLFDDDATTNIRTTPTSTYAFGLMKSDGDAAISIQGGSPTFNFFGTVENTPPSGGNNFLAEIRGTPAGAPITDAVIDISGPGLTPLNDSADGIFIDNAVGGTITMSGLNLTGTGQFGIHVRNTSATLAFANTTIEGPSEYGILLEDSSADATFDNTTINLDGTGVIAGIGLGDGAPTYTGDIDFLNLSATTAQNGTTFLANSANSITISGASSLTSTSTVSPVIDVTATTLDITLTSVSSNLAATVPNPDTGSTVAVELGNSGTFTITDSFLIDGNPGSDTDPPGSNIRSSAGVTVTIP